MSWSLVISRLIFVPLCIVLNFVTLRFVLLHLLFYIIFTIARTLHEAYFSFVQYCPFGYYNSVLLLTVCVKSWTWNLNYPQAVVLVWQLGMLWILNGWSHENYMRISFISNVYKTFYFCGSSIRSSQCCQITTIRCS